MAETYNGRTFYTLSNLKTACGKAGYDIRAERDTITITIPNSNMPPAVYSSSQEGIDTAMADVLGQFGTADYDEEPEQEEALDPAIIQRLIAFEQSLRMPRLSLRPRISVVNYYQAEMYPRDLIVDFVRSQPNLEEAPALTPKEAKEQLGHEIRIELFYRFTDDEKNTPAMAFASHYYGYQGFPVLAVEPGDADKPEGLTRLLFPIMELTKMPVEEMFFPVWIDPSLSDLWRAEMDRDREV